MTSSSPASSRHALSRQAGVVAVDPVGHPAQTLREVAVSAGDRRPDAAIDDGARGS